MGCVEYEGFYLKEEELKTLLAGLGIVKCYGLFEQAKRQHVSQADVHQIMANLYQKELVDWENGQIVVRQSFSKILSVIKKCSKCITIHGRREEIPVRCCYFANGEVVITERSQREAGTLCLSLLEEEMWITRLLESMEIRENLVDEPEIPNRKYRTSFEKLWEKESLAYFSEETVQWVFALQSSNANHCMEKMILLEDGVQTYCVRQQNMGMRFELYHADVFAENLKEWMRGNRDDIG